MKFRGLIKILIILIILAAVAAPLKFILRGPRSWIAGFDSSAQKTFEAVEIGHTHHHAVSKLGPFDYARLVSLDAASLPFAESAKKENSSDRRIELNPKPWFLNFIKKPVAPQTAYYLVWINGMNWYYFLGFDLDGRVVSTGEGHS